MSEHIGPGFDSGAFKADEANIRAQVDELDRKRRDVLVAEAKAAEEEAARQARPKSRRRR